MFCNVLWIASAEAAEAAAPYQRGGDGVFDMIRHAGPMVQFILLLLVSLSVACWCVTFLKFRLFHRVRKESDVFIDMFRQRKSFAGLYKDTQMLDDSHLAQIFRVGFTELNRLNKSMDVKNIQEIRLHPEILLENVERAMRGALATESQRLEQFVPLLATTGSTAPFVGLFGTVWGIMASFQEIGSKGSASLAVVAPGISEALIATAIGLAAAIPAVIAYNYLTNRVRTLENDMNYFLSDFLNLLKRDIMRRIKQDGPSLEQQAAAQD